MHFLRGRATKSSTTRHCPPASAKGPVPVPPSQAPTYRRGIAPFRPCGPGPAGVGSPPPPARPPRNFSLRFPRAGRSNVAGAVTAARGRIAPRWPGGLRPMPARARLRRPRVGPGRPEQRNVRARVRACVRARTNASTLAHRRGRRGVEVSKMGNKIQKRETKSSAPGHGTKGPVPVPPSPAPAFRRDIASFRPCMARVRARLGPAGDGVRQRPGRPAAAANLRFDFAGLPISLKFRFDFLGSMISPSLSSDFFPSPAPFAIRRPPPAQPPPPRPGAGRPVAHTGPGPAQASPDGAVPARTAQCTHMHARARTHTHTRARTRARACPSGPVRPGPVRSGPFRFGPVRPGPARPGWNRDAQLGKGGASRGRACTTHKR